MTQDSKITVKCSNNTSTSRSWDKKYYCVYCEKPYSKIPRHLEDKHKSETAVVKLLNLTPTETDTKETAKLKIAMWKTILDDLRKKGNYNHNMMVLRRGFGVLIVKRCPPKEVPYTSYLPCEYCLYFYYRKDLHRHVKHCSAGKNISRSSKRGHRVQGSAAMLLPVHSEVSEPLKKIFERMKVDEVSLSLKVDNTIIKYGNTLCRKHYNNSDQTYHISNKLREIGRLLIKRRENTSVTCVDDIVNPAIFPKVISSVTELCGFNEETKEIEAPSLGIKLGQILGKIAFLIKGEAIIHLDKEKRKRADDFISLLQIRWNDEIAKLSRTELETRKWNKPKILPLTEDLQLLRKHLAGVQVTSISELGKDNTSLKDWRDLCSSVLASLILLNRRREGEASKLELGHIEDICSGLPNDDIKASLSSFELKLCDHFKRVEIRGKRGRKVPMLLTKDLEKALTLIVI